MKLSKKYTTIYIVIATFHDAHSRLLRFRTADMAKDQRRTWEREFPDAFVQIHTIDQALPEVPKP